MSDDEDLEELAYAHGLIDGLRRALTLVELTSGMYEQSEYAAGIDAAVREIEERLESDIARLEGTSTGDTK